MKILTEQEINQRLNNNVEMFCYFNVGKLKFGVVFADKYIMIDRRLINKIERSPVKSAENITNCKQWLNEQQLTNKDLRIYSDLELFVSSLPVLEDIK